MNDRPQDRGEDRRRRGPLGGEEGAEETRGTPEAGSTGEGDAETRQVPLEDTGRERASRASSSEETSRTAPDEESPETRVIRTPDSRGDQAQYPSGYPEPAEMREARLREEYGGVDWLASFIGCIFAVISGGVLLALSSLVLAPLGFTLGLGGQEVTAAAVVGLVILGLILFLAYFIGGYVAGRLVRFDGGRNGAVTVLWGVLLAVIFALFGSFLPGDAFGFLADFVQNRVVPAIGTLAELGLAGLGILVGALLLEVLGGFLGGLVGHRYHTRIDSTT